MKAKKRQTTSLAVSVVIPAFNEEKYLPHTLRSLQKQTVKPCEILVVDNNSTDQTAKVANMMNASVIREKKTRIRI